MSIQSHFVGTAGALAALVATASAIAALAPSSAAAQDRPVTIYGDSVDSRTELVSFAKLDLGKSSDQRRLNRRVATAVERVCLRDIGRDGLQDRDYYACHARAWNDATPQIAQAIARSSDLALRGGAPLAITTIRVAAR